MSASGPQPSPAQDRVIRVFLSSTFRDMHAERDCLVKRVFPDLHDWCAQRPGWLRSPAVRLLEPRGPNAGPVLRILSPFLTSAGGRDGVGCAARGGFTEEIEEQYHES